MANKLSDKLRLQAADLWAEAADKPFVREMAEGTLPEDRFRNYMLQDFLYLQDYIEILRLTLNYTEDPALRGFLDRITEETLHETYRVHLPNMKRLGVSDDEIAGCAREPVIEEYVRYMREQLEEGGLRAGLTALLQCSWVYAYIGQKTDEKYHMSVLSSPYRFWFEAYTCEDYIRANDMWIEALDGICAELSEEETESLCRIFRTCAEYENRFWDTL